MTTQADSDATAEVSKLYTQYWNSVISGQEFQKRIVGLISAAAKTAQHLHTYSDDDYRCIYCHLSLQELMDNTVKYQEET